MGNALNNVECPAMPTWLEEPLRLSEKGRAYFDKVPPHILDLLTLFRRAKEGSEHSAAMLAMKFESGDVPSGPDLTAAFSWHQYAVSLGSAASALRMAGLLVWSEHEADPEASIQLAQCALDLTLKKKYVDKEDWHIAAVATLLILERTPDVTSRGLIEELLSRKKFASHPDFRRITGALHKARCQTGDDLLSLTVAQSSIVEDGGFKAGIYKSLQYPLPLTPVAADPEAIRNILDQEFPWFRHVNALVYRQMVVAQTSQKPAFRMRPLLLAGVAGVGKTTWAKRLAELCKVPFRTVMAAGGADSMFLRGTARGWSSARPGAVIQTIAIEGVANPLFLVDELEKASNDSKNGRIWDVLLQMLEPASSRAYLDECLEVPCDLSWVSWIATANELGPLPKPLLDRFTIVLVEPPGGEHFMSMVHGAVRGFAQELGIDPRMLPMLDGDELDILRRCKNPRELNRTVRLMMEQSLVQIRQTRGH